MLYVAFTRSRVRLATRDPRPGGELKGTPIQLCFPQKNAFRNSLVPEETITSYTIIEKKKLSTLHSLSGIHRLHTAVDYNVISDPRKQHAARCM